MRSRARAAGQTLLRIATWLAALVPARTLGAQRIVPDASASSGAVTAVSGRITLLERAGRAGDDLSSAVLWLEPTDGAAHGRDTIPRTAAIAMRLREFVPRVQLVAVGGAVKFPNQDPFSHNVFSNAEIGRFDLGLYRRRDTRSATFRQSGVYAVYCNIHPRMASYVVAVPGPHVTRATPSGTFTLRGVAPGRYVLRVWHERAPELAQTIVVSASTPPVALTLDARGYVPGPHLNKFGQPYATTRADRY